MNFLLDFLVDFAQTFFGDFDFKLQFLHNLLLFVEVTEGAGQEVEFPRLLLGTQLNEAEEFVGLI